MDYDTRVKNYNPEELKEQVQELIEPYRNDPALKMNEEVQGKLNRLMEKLGEPMYPPIKPEIGGGDQTIYGSTKRANQLAGPHSDKQYRCLFGNGDGFNWQDKSTDFFSAVFSKRHHPELTTRAMGEGIPSSGGFLVPTETSAQIHNVALESELIMPRAYVQPMTSNQIKLPAMEIGDHSSNLYGGFTASWTAEAGTITAAEPKTRQMTLDANKLTGLLRFSHELSEDIPNGFDQIVRICGKGLSWYRDLAFIKGSGAGQPLGILNANCLVTQGKETGQAASTIVWENLVGMLSKMYAGSFPNSVWICHQTTIPALMSTSVPVGTGGSFAPALLGAETGKFSMLTRPVIFTEKLEPLGTLGDIILVDLSQYIVGIRGELRFDLSPHVHFETDEILAKIVSRCDGQPLWDEVLTLEDGTTEVSPFVALEAR